MKIYKIDPKKAEKKVKNWNKKNVAPTLYNIIENKDFCYITPDEYLVMDRERGSVDIEGAEDITRHLTEEQLITMAKRADGGKHRCHCGLLVWEFGSCDMCFTCTTGETDPSDDFELTMNPKKQPHWEGG